MVLIDLTHYACQTANLYYPYSRSHQIKDSPEQKKRALRIVRERGKATAQELAAELGVRVGTVRSRYLEPLLTNGEIGRKKINGVFHYSPLD